MKNNKNILIIGAGVHGCFLAKYLSKKKFNIFLLEKESDICKGSSGATHNRANRGFHYPRSKQTASECKNAYNYFEKNYKKYFKKLNSYYCIEKKSKINFKEYVKFFKKNKLKFKIIKSNKYLKNNNLEGIIQAEEGCFDHLKIKNTLKKYLKKQNINLYFNFDLKKVKKKGGQLSLISKKNRVITKKIDIIINATYDNSNNLIKIFFKNQKTKKYRHQLTEVVVVKSKIKMPGITIMDGPFATIMPYMGTKNKYLLYDVTNSILKTSSKPIANKIKKTNYKKIKKKLSKYMNFTNYFTYDSSNYGNRPVPLIDKESNRATKISELNYKQIKFINIQEGKYISAPYIAKKLSNKIKSYLK